MPNWLTITLCFAALVPLGLVVATAIGGRRWRRASARLVAGLLRDTAEPAVRVFEPRELEGLPEPVARYFRLALRPGQPLLRSVRLTQTGEFRIGECARGWRAMRAHQRFCVGPRAFLWDARIRVAPLLAVRVRDTYLHGEARMQARIAGVVPLLDERGKAELNAGALQRYLAEAVWFPTALLPSQGVRWSAIDADRALATLTDGGATVSLEFRFDAAGGVAEVFAPARYREVHGRYLPTPWRGRFSHYREQAGMRIPAQGEVAWQLDAVWLPYWRARIEAIEYDFAQ